MQLRADRIDHIATRRDTTPRPRPRHSARRDAPTVRAHVADLLARANAGGARRAFDDTARAGGAR